MEILFEYFYIKCGSYLLMYSTQHQNRYIPLRDFYKTYPSSITLLREKSKPKSPNLDTVRDLDFNFSHKAWNIHSCVKPFAVRVSEYTLERVMKERLRSNNRKTNPKGQ